MLSHGIIGNCKTCALINKDATVEWLCFPDFDSPSVFARLLDEENGGCFRIEPRGEYKIVQEYQQHTNILQTTFTSKKAAFVVIDFFPRYRELLPGKKTKLLRNNNLVRLIKPLRGKPIIRVVYDPRPGYAKGPARHRVVKGVLQTRTKKESLDMVSNVDYDLLTEGLYFKLDYTKYFVIGCPKDASQYNAARLQRLASATRQYWRRWVGSLTVPDQNRELIIRSALTLKLLTSSETGAIVAAPTTSLPEELGGVRNWDYRYCWVRDASLTVDALKKIGRDHEAKKLMGFFFEYSINKRKPLQLMYSVRGETKLTERTLDHLAGYADSRPVRVGNAAYNQKQNDIYGSLIDLLYLYYVFYEYEQRMTGKYWSFLKYLVGEINKRWRTKDQGIWEFRGRKEHFTYSKLMCYVGIDRAVRIAQKYGRAAEAEVWAILRDDIQQDLLRNAWNERQRAFTMYYGADELDASVLQLTYHDVLANDDPRLMQTIKAIEKELRQGPFVQRYKAKDDFGSSKSAFSICSFWLVDALYYIGEAEQAKQLFGQLTTLANPLGLYSEDFELGSGRLLGNFPQAYSHTALINSALLLSEWSAKRKKVSPKGPRIA